MWPMDFAKKIANSLLRRGRVVLKSGNGDIHTYSASPYLHVCPLFGAGDAVRIHASSYRNDYHKNDGWDVVEEPFTDV